MKTNLSQRGVVHLLVPLLLIGGIIATVWLITAGPLNLFPKASVSGPTGPTTSFSLSSDTGAVKVGEKVGVGIIVRSDVAATNLFKAKIKFPKDLLVVDSIDYSGSLIKNWVEQYYDNATGEISLVGGVPNPGFQTSPNGSGVGMAVIYFRALKAGSATISFADDSAIYDNANNLNILSSKVNSTVSITTGGTSNPVPTTTPRPAPSGQSINYQKDYSGTQGKNNIYYLAYTKAKNVYSNASFDGTNWKFTGSDSDRNFLIEKNKIAPSWPSNVVIRWKAPQSGNITISGYFLRCCSESGDYSYKPYTIFSVRKNTAELWKQETNNTNKYDYTLTNTVSEGDNIEFWVDANNDSGWDGTWIDFTIVYQFAVAVVATPAPTKTGDGNKDGKVDLVDLSILFTDFNKGKNFREQIDLNSDTRVNTVDYGLMKNVLVKNKIIKSN